MPQKSAILTKVKKIISKLKTRIEPSKSNPILKQIDIISCLEPLQKCFFFFLLIKYIIRYYAEVTFKEISVIEHGNNTYCKANKNCAEVAKENTEHTKRLGFKIMEKEKNYRSCTGLLKCTRIQLVNILASFSI